MKYDYHIIIIGGGSAGLVTASGGASLGAKVALIEKEKMGGECLNTGCIPSKSLLKAAHLSSDIKHAADYGLSAVLKKTDALKVMKRIWSVMDTIAPHDSAERFQSLGVDVIRGRAIIVDRHSVNVNGRVITGKFIVIATGSVPAVPQIPGLDRISYYTNNNIFKIRRLPEKLIILGAGSMGLEIGQAFRSLGSGVEIIDKAEGIFYRDDAEVATLMEKVLSNEGIVLHLSAKITGIKKTAKTVTVNIIKNDRREVIRGTELLVCTGRVPATDGLGLDNAGIKTDSSGFISVNRFLQTNVKNIYACGDAAGPYLFTHAAGYQAGIVLRNITFPYIKSSVDYSNLPWVTFTKPEVAHTGFTEQSAGEAGKLKDTLLVDIKENDRAVTDNDKDGFLKLILGRGNRIIGATIVSNKAGDLIPLASMAISFRMKPTDFIKQIFPYPVEAEIFKTAGYTFVRKLFNPWMKNLVSRIFFR